MVKLNSKAKMKIKRGPQIELVNDQQAQTRTGASRDPEPEDHTFRMATLDVGPGFFGDSH
jgi:hypothetical protein